MMMCEFIERTGFEPTAAEYQQIEAEYMGCDIDKDKFCRDWKRNGGIQRLSRMRIRRIEELEQQLATARKHSEESEKYWSVREAELCSRLNQARTERDAAVNTLNAIRNLI